MTINFFFSRGRGRVGGVLGPVGERGGVQGGGAVVGRRHLPVTGRDSAFRHPAVWGYLFLGDLNGKERRAK